MTQTFEIVDNDIVSLQAYLDARNGENKVVSFACAPHGNSHFVAMTTLYPTNLSIDQIIEIKSITDIPEINSWIATQNASDYIVSFIQVRHTTNDVYLLATKTIAI